MTLEVDASEGFEAGKPGSAQAVDNVTADIKTPISAALSIGVVPSLSGETIK
jgi:hypothetical protein